MTHPTHAHPLRGILLIMLAVFMFSSMDTLAKHMLKREAYPLPPLIFARYAVHLAFMLALLAPRMGLNLVRTQRLGLQVLRGLLLVASTAFFYLSLTYLPLAEAAAISFVGPVLVAALSGPLLRERIGRRQWLAVGLGFLGVLIIVRPGGGVFTVHVVFPLICALLFSLYQVLTRKLAGRENAMTTLFFTALVGALITALPLPFTWQTPTVLQLTFMIGIGMFGGFGHFLLIRAVEQASPAALAPFVYTQLVWSTLLAFLAFGEFPDSGSLLGMAVIVAGGLLAVNWEQIRRAK
ncbi:MAG: DMT family transporter [Burkholderiales bacterium]|nr:DMT family transporter [Burkholderiales bacterium]